MSKIKIEKLSHYAVILIALSALFISIFQLRILHDHNKLTVRPYLSSTVDQLDSTLTVTFSNEGFGPAIIERITFKSKDQSYDTLEDLLVGTDEKKNRKGSYQYGKNSIIASGDTKLLVTLKKRNLRGFQVQIWYKSIYDEQDNLVIEF